MAVINTNVEKMYLGTKPDGSAVTALIVDDSAFMVKTISGCWKGLVVRC